MHVDISQLLNRIKNSSYHTVEVDLPEGFELSGPVPFDIEINNGTAAFKVLAVDEDTATERVYEYLNELDQGQSNDEI